jgi:hypothetical protein
MFTSGVAKSGLGNYTTLAAEPIKTPLVTSSNASLRDDIGDPIAPYAMVNESGAVWVNEQDTQMVAQ